MRETRITGAKAVLESLIHERVTQVFGYPGGAIMPIYDALYDYDTRLNHTLVRHEQGAIHAAQGYARASGKVGVVFATSGPGATNLITGLADALIDSTPLVCITGQVASHLLGTDAFQESDVIALSTAVTKWNIQVTEVEALADALAKAFYIARSGRPGPVLIDITKDVQFALVDWLYTPCEFIKSYRPEPVMNRGVLEAASLCINQAKKPMLLIGQGVILSQGEVELIAFVEKSGIPVASTLLGLGAFPQHHDLYIGMLGMHGDYAPNVKTNECDLLIAVGMRFDDRVTGDVNRYAKQAKIIHIDIDEAEFNKIIPVDFEIHADAKQALAFLTANVEKKSHHQWVSEFKQGKQFEIETLESKKQQSGVTDITMTEVVQLISDMTQGNAVIVSDVGQHQMIAARHYQYRYSKSHITSGGLGTMGFALPAAIGAKIGVPEKTVLAIIGDGGFQMTLQELGTIMQSQIDVKIVILNNEFLGMVRQWQQLFLRKGIHLQPWKIQILSL